jgi:hypothetical protein
MYREGHRHSMRFRAHQTVNPALTGKAQTILPQRPAVISYRGSVSWRAPAKKGNYPADLS